MSSQRKCSRKFAVSGVFALAKLLLVDGETLSGPLSAHFHRSEELEVDRNFVASDNPGPTQDIDLHGQEVAASVLRGEN